jgi:hypothetical protein
MPPSVDDEATQTTKPPPLPRSVLPTRPPPLGPNDREKWFVVLESEFHGPISRHTLAQVLAEHPHDDGVPLWNAAHGDEWTELRAIPGLAAEVARLRAARADREWVRHPSELAPFASSSPERAPAVGASTSGAVDIGAALAAMTAHAHTKRDVPAPPIVIPPAPSPPPPDGRAREWRFLGGGVALGGLAVAASVLVTLGVVRPSASAIAPAAPEAASVDAPIEALVAPTLAAAPPRELPATEVAPVTPTSVVREPLIDDEEHHHHHHHHGADVVALVDDDVEPAIDEASADAPIEAAAAEEPAAEEASVRDEAGEEADAEEAEAPPVEEAPAERSIDELIVAAVPIETAPAPTRAEEAAAIARAAPTEVELVRALEHVRSEVAACTPAHAVAALRLTIHGPTGRVNGVYVDGVFAGTPVGSCIARAVRHARVAPFTELTYAFSYPFRL